MSLPSRERGLKYDLEDCGNFDTVAPLTGAWIEMHCEVFKMEKSEPSLPSRERGLKYLYCKKRYWIDMGRSPHGSVD